jgi:transposase-like protein
MTVYLPLECPSCKDTKSIVRFGKASNNKQRYCCQNDACSRKTFIVGYDNKGWLKDVKDKIIDMAVNGSGIRDTARVLGISRETVLSTIKKRR